MTEDSYTVRIRNNDTGEIRSCVMNISWTEYSLSWWIDGNMECDCNRKMLFDSAEYSDDVICGSTAYTVIDATLNDGTVIEIEGEKQ